MEWSLLQSFVPDEFVQSVAEMDRDRIRIFLEPMAFKQTTVAKVLNALKQQEAKIAGRRLTWALTPRSWL